MVDHFQLIEKSTWCSLVFALVDKDGGYPTPSERFSNQNIW